MKRTMVVADEGEEERVQTNMAAIAEGEERQQQKRRSGEIVEEDVGDCKRPRTERICTVMTTIEEEVCGTRIRLFKWNESLFDDHFSGYGIIMIRVYNNFNNGSSSPDGTFVEQLVSLFDLTKLRSGDSMKSVAMMALADTNAFADRTTIEALAEEISTYLSSNFRFTKRTLSCSRTRRIVVLVEVDMITTTEYRLIEDEETIMAIHQGCGNNGDSYLQGENHDQYDEQCFVNFHIQLEDDSMESVTEEAGVDHDYEVGYGESETGDQEEEEQEEEEHEEAGVDHDYEAGFMESETGDQEEEEEEEEIQAEDDMEEVSSSVASDPELMEIEYTIWRFLGDLPMFNRGDREFSRDAKGLKKVESAIEIIMECHDGNDFSKEVDSCPCCLEGFVVEGKAVAKTRCSHLFHRDCLCLWLSRKDSCPLCRSKCATYV